MKKTDLTFVLMMAALLLMTAGCGEKATTTTHGDKPATTAQTGDQPSGETAAEPDVLTGEVVESMDSGGYTYVQVDTGEEKIWAAGPVTAVEVGQKVSLPKGMVMTDFASKTLDRTFEAVLFVDAIYTADAMPKAGEHPTGGSMANNVVGDAKVEGVTKLADGYTVADIFTQKETLSGQPVKLRGRVVKFTANIMGTNWVHIQDGTEGDLTVTTDAVVAKGDLVVVEGDLTVNKDFGAGYKYDAIIEGAKVTKE